MKPRHDVSGATGRRRNSRNLNKQSGWMWMPLLGWLLRLAIIYDCTCVNVNVQRSIFCSMEHQSKVWDMFAETETTQPHHKQPPHGQQQQRCSVPSAVRSNNIEPRERYEERAVILTVSTVGRYCGWTRVGVSLTRHPPTIDHDGLVVVFLE